jgi:hypothetical protein
VFGVPWSPDFVLGLPPQEVVLGNSPSNHETWSIQCHVGIHVDFTSILHSHNIWGTDGVSECKMDAKSTRIPTWHWMDHVSWLLGLFPNTTSCGGKPNTKPGDHGTPNTHDRLYILFYHGWVPSWIEIHRNSIRVRVRDHATWFWRCLGIAFGHTLLSSHNIMVTALGSCVKWP